MNRATNHTVTNLGSAGAALREAPPSSAAAVAGDGRPDRPGRRNPFYALGFRNYRLFFFGQLISVAGTWMQTVAQQWLVYSLTGSAAWLGVVSGVSALPYVAFSIWGGQVADRYPRRTTLIRTQVASMLLSVVLAVLAALHLVAAWHIAALAALAGVINAFNMPAQHAFMSDIVEERSALGNAIALNSLRFNLARFVGPILAGAVLTRLGAAACFAINAASFLAVIASLLLIRVVHTTPESTRDQSVWEGFTYIRRNARALRVVALVGAGSLFAWSASTLYPMFAGRFGVGAAGFSTIMAVNGCGAALGGLFTALAGERVPRRTLVYGGALVFGGVLFVLALLLQFAGRGGYPLVLACLGLGGFSMIVFGINANTSVQEDVPNEVRGRVMAVYSLVFGGLMPVGGLAIGFLAEHVGTPAAVGINAVLFLITTIGLLLWSQADRRRRSEPVPVESR